MSRRARLAVFGVAAAGLAALLFWSLVGLPDFGSYQGGYGNQLNREVVPERHTTNVVGAVVFDYRGFDTLGEEFILFTAVLAVAMLLRHGKDEEERERERQRDVRDETRSDAVRLTCLLLLPPIFVLGLWLVAFGYVTPGGGFQGGVLIAGAFLLAYIAAGYKRFNDLAPHRAVELVEGVGGAGAFALLGVAGLVAEGAYLQNFLGSGDTGTLFAGGSIPLLNWAAAIEVAAAMVILFGEFVYEYVVPLSQESR